MRDKIKRIGVTFDTIYTDDWSSFTKAFELDNHIFVTFFNPNDEKDLEKKLLELLAYGSRREKLKTILWNLSWRIIGV